jgi:hypothetical protein
MSIFINIDIFEEIVSGNLFAIFRFPLICPGQGSPYWNTSMRNNLHGTILTILKIRKNQGLG